MIMPARQAFCEAVENRFQEEINELNHVIMDAVDLGCFEVKITENDRSGAVHTAERLHNKENNVVEILKSYAEFHGYRVATGADGDATSFVLISWSDQK